MRTQTRLTALAVGVLLALLASLPAAAVPMSVLKIVDLNGNVLTDLDGNPTIATVADNPFPGTSVTVGFDLIVPANVPFSTAGQVRLSDHFPDPTTQQVPLLDLVNAQLFSSGGTGSSLLSVELRSFTPPYNVTTCQQVGPGQCYLNIGEFIDVTAKLFPGMTTSFRVLVQSDPPPTVPEPGTAVLLGFGLAGLARAGRRKLR
jgi:hypothetical protein